MDEIPKYFHSDRNMTHIKPELINFKNFVAETPQNTYLFHNDSMKFLFKLLPVMVFLGAMIGFIGISLEIRHIIVYLAGFALTWGPLLYLFIYRVNNGALEFDCVNKCVIVRGRQSIKDYCVVPFNELEMRYEVQNGMSRPDIIEFYNRGNIDALYRLHLNTKDQWLYEDLLAFIRQITNNGLKEVVTDIKPYSGIADSLISVIITLGLFFTLAFFVFGTPVAFAYFTNTGILGGISALFAMFLLLVISTLRLGIESRTWPSIKGKILSSGVRENKSTSSSTDSGSTTTIKYEPQIQYQYTVKGKEYIGKTLAFYDTSEYKFEKAKVIADTYEVGSSVEVFFKPDRPVMSVLKTGNAISTWTIAVIFGFGMIVTSFFASHDWAGIQSERFSNDMPYLYEILVRSGIVKE